MATPRKPTSISTARVKRLEDQVATLSWLHAELSYAIKLAVAQQVQQQLMQSPQVQQAIMAKLMNGSLQ